MQWPLILCLTKALCILRGAWAQYGVPVGVGMGVYAVPQPQVMPMLVPALVMQPSHARTTTTTTTPRSVAVAVPVPVPMGVPYAVNALPAFPAAACEAKSRPPGCPACPPCHCSPSCTPAFFSYCSSCHQRCRCRDPNEAPAPPPPPQPMAMPMAVQAPVPPPVVMMPFPPSINLPKKHKLKRFPCSGSSDTSADTTDDSSSYESWESSDIENYYKRIRKRRNRRKRIFSRRNARSDSEVVKPVLSYVSQNGAVKYKQKISNAEASRLLDKKRNDNTQVDTIHWLPGGESSALAENRRQIIVKSDNSKGTLRQSKKQIVFRPPAHKKISNLSVSFQVAE